MAIIRILFGFCMTLVSEEEFIHLMLPYRKAYMNFKNMRMAIPKRSNTPPKLRYFRTSSYTPLCGRALVVVLVVPSEAVILTVCAASASQSMTFVALASFLTILEVSVSAVSQSKVMLVE